MRRYCFFLLLLLFILPSIVFGQTVSREQWTINKISISHSPVILNTGDEYFVQGEVSGEAFALESEADRINTLCVREALFCSYCPSSSGNGAETYGSIPNTIEDAQLCCLTKLRGVDGNGYVKFEGTCNFAWADNITCYKQSDPKNPDPNNPDCDPELITENNYEVRLIGSDNNTKNHLELSDFTTNIKASRAFAVPVISPDRVATSTTPKGDQPTMMNVLTDSTVLIFLDRMISVMFWVISSFAFVMILIGGFMMTTSAGEPSRVTKGRNTVFFAIAGFAIVSIARGIVALIQAIMGARQ